MSCPKNIIHRKFLWWSWTTEGNHDLRIYSISKFMRSSETFHVTRTCSHCGISKTEHFVEPEELLRIGISIEQMATITDFHYLYPKNL